MKTNGGFTPRTAPTTISEARFGAPGRGCTAHPADSACNMSTRDLLASQGADEATLADADPAAGTGYEWPGGRCIP